MKTKYYLISLFAVLLIAFEAAGQTELQNYISTFDIQQAGVTNPAELRNGIPVSKAIQTIQYFDGLGRLVQTVQVGVSPTGKDVIKPVEYNAVGLDEKNLLPYSDIDANGSYREQYETGNQAFYNQLFDDTYGRVPIEYEKSPLHRVLKQGSAGEAWQIDLGSHQGKYKTFDYLTNKNNDAYLTVKLWNVSGAQCVLAGTYSDNQLYVIRTTDEDENVVYEFKDKTGLVVLKRMVDGTELLDTYYVYDDFGLLRFVISPEGSDLINETFDIRNPNALQYVYFYNYDGRKRLIEKKIPGKAFEYYVYNKSDLPVLYQDGNLQQLGRWQFTKYDALGRVIMTGLLESSNDRSYHQTQADQCAYNWEYMISPPGNTGNNNYYSNIAYPGFASSEIWSVVLLTVNYYDRYTFYKNNSGTISLQSLHNDNQLNLDIPAPLIEIYNPDQKSVTGMPTVSFTNFSANYNTNEYATSVMYYDKYGRNIQTRMENHMQGYDFYTNRYQELTSRIINSKHTQKVTVGHLTSTRTEETQNAYDAFGRLTVSDYCFDGMTPHQNTMLAYDAAGNMVTKTQGAGGSSAPYQTIVYDYNIKGWLTQINDPNTVSDQGALFGMKLFYNDQDIDVGNADLYNGNISGIKWQNTGALSTQSNPVGGLKAYSYDYDGINRLENGTYREVVQNTWNNNNKYNEALTYDRNGNIETLQRKGMHNNIIGIIDDLEYEYKGNQLIAVDDDCKDNAAGGFADNGNYYTTVPEYNYDANGNMTSDVNKGIEGLTYNYMNLLNSARRGLNECVEYLYDASGVKLQQKHSNRSTNYQFITDFVTNFVYEDGQLAHVNTPEGRIVYNTNGTIRQEFNLKDHLGNVRVVYSVENGVVTTRQIDNYYPFGYNIKGLSVNKYATTRPNEYFYNGKMMQDEAGLNWLDYGARMYDAVLGRWNVVDPLAEKMPGWTPYRYAFNNPLKYTDINGFIEWPLTGTSAVNKRDVPNGGYGLKNTVVRTSTYLDTDRPPGSSNPHCGIDYRATVGTSFYSLGDGKVVAIGSSKKGGNYITVEYGNGDQITFRHIKSTADGLEKGSKVYEGQVLGETGKSGTKSPHLHIDARDSEGKRIDPENQNYGTITNEEFFTTYSGDYEKLKEAKESQQQSTPEQSTQNKESLWGAFKRIWSGDWSWPKK